MTNGLSGWKICPLAQVCAVARKIVPHNNAKQFAHFLYLNPSSLFKLLEKETVFIGFIWNTSSYGVFQILKWQSKMRTRTSLR